MANDIDDLNSRLLQNQPLLEQSLMLKCGDCFIQLRSNSRTLLGVLQQYFRHVLVDVGAADIMVTAIDSEPLQLPFEFQDWPREPGKSGRKDAYVDCRGARLIQKVRTGMVFLQSERYRTAAGPCLKHPNQVINFINSQHMNWLQQRDWLICHAAAVAWKNRGYAIAGFSGGGKSTFMLHLLDDENLNYITNDRLFIRHRTDGVESAGIAKLPRINPGTIVNNPRLHNLIAGPERTRLRSLPKQQLWDIDRKYDVDIEKIYGAGRIMDQVPLHAFIVLNWRHDSDQALTVVPCNLSERTDLLAAIMKSPGPFYQDRQGKFLSGHEAFNEQTYLKVLSETAVFEASGRVDFESLRGFFYQDIISGAKNGQKTE